MRSALLPVQVQGLSSRMNVCMLVGFLAFAHAAKQNQDQGSDLVSELRKVPKPTLDATGKFHTFRKNFVRNDPQTGEYTRFVYNCTRPVDLFVDLNNNEDFAVKNISCMPNSLVIEVSTTEGSLALRSALLRSSSGLIMVTGSQWGCLSPKNGEVLPLAYRSFWTPSWNTTKHGIEYGATPNSPIMLETLDESPISFLGQTSFSFFTNHTEVKQAARVKYYQSFDVVNVNFNRDTESAATPSIPLQTGRGASITCDECYLYLGGGVGAEMETSSVSIPIYVKAWVDGLFSASANLNAVVRKPHS
jgi:hypothetical protein